MVNPRGIRLLGARVTGKLDLSHVKVPFSIAMIRCSIPERMNFESAEIPKLDLHAQLDPGEIFAEHQRARRCRHWLGQPRLWRSISTSAKSISITRT